MKKWIVDVEEDRDGAYIKLPDDLLYEVQWKEGDEIEWIDNEDGSWTMKKKEVPVETEFVLVEAIQMYRMRYVVEVPKGKTEWAGDTVTMNEAKEFSQKDLGETITTMRAVSREEILKLCDEDNSYVKSWNIDAKFKSFVTYMESNDE